MHANKYNEKLHYYPFRIKLDRRVGSYNTLNDLSNKVCIPKETEDLIIHICSYDYRKK